MEKSTQEFSTWDRFHGYGSGSVTNAELRLLFNEAKAAYPYLMANVRHLGWVCVRENISTLNRISDYARARGLSGDWNLPI